MVLGRRWQQKLRAATEVQGKVPSEDDSATETQAKRDGSEYCDWSERRPMSGEGAAAVIPRLCPQGDVEIMCKLAVCEREWVVEQMTKELPSPQQVWTCLMDASEGGEKDPEAMALRGGDEASPILPSYGAYRAAALRLVQPSVYHTNDYVTPHLFYLADRGGRGGSDTAAEAAPIASPQRAKGHGGEDSASTATPAFPIFTHVTRKTLLSNVRLMLESCDSSGEGYLSEADMEAFIDMLMPNLRTVRNIASIMGGHYQVFYKCHACRRFFFFLDPSRRGRIPVQTIIDSEVLMDLIKLYQLNPDECKTADDDIPADLQDNWFTFQIMYRVYQHYVELDADWNGMLSFDEMNAYNNSSFSPFFVTRVFECYPTVGYSDEIDFKKYLDFVLATEHSSTDQAAAYFWKALDVGEAGFLPRPLIHLFAEQLARKLLDSRLMTVDAEDITREIFDMVNPVDPERITFEDLKACGQMGTVLSILTDHRAFHNYDNRENILACHSSSQREEQGSGYC
eukprot:TRINITY_DN17894_c0_g1_i1.p1 TRINITY_DN17894_c0_g1~~TRINITY_DN17894_c0_g1_i1.p1  ORF type:complete len:511 (+),score=175.57 TRINITY_DN17894_c0_g1_i1:50-1582(+)